MLTYKLYISQSNNLDTVANAEKNGTLAATGTDVSFLTAQNLTSSNSYFYNVVVEGEVGKVAYTQNTVELVDSGTIPLNSPILSIIYLGLTTVNVNRTNITNAESYEYRLNGSITVNIGLSNPFTVADLARNSTYTLEIRAVNSNGMGPWSSPITFKTGVEVTDTPVINSVENNNVINGVNVNYTGVEFASSYQWRVNNGTINTLGDVESFQIPNLLGNTSYGLEIRGVNEYGSGPWSGVFTFITRPKTEPTVTSSIIGDTITFTITNPDALDVEIFKNGTWVNEGNVTEIVVSDLAEGASLSNKFRFRNAGGVGPETTVTYQTDERPQSAPTITNTEASPGIVTVNINLITDITGVEYRLNAGTPVDVGLTSQFDVTTGTPEETYNLDVRYYNEWGGGGWSDPVSITIPENIAPIISDATLTTSDITESGYTLSWTEATDNVSVQANIVYKVYEAIIGEEDQLNNVNTIETQIFKGSVTGTSTINITTGELFSTVNVLAEDEEGNKSIYAPTDVAVLDPQVNNVNIVPDSFDLIEGDTTQNTYDFQVEVDTQDGADDTVTVTSSNTAIVTVSDLGGNMFRATLVEPTTESKTITLTAVSNFYSFFTDTVNVSVVSHTFDDTNESNSRELEVLNV